MQTFVTFVMGIPTKCLHQANRLSAYYIKLIVESKNA